MLLMILQALLDAFENGEMELKTPTKKEREFIMQTAKNTLKKQSNPGE